MIPFDSSGAFHVLAEGRELRRLAIRGAAATVSVAGLGLAVQLVGTLVLARLLVPSDFGVVTMVTTFSLLLASFGLNGFTEAIIQFEEIDHYTASNLFWLNLAIGLILAIALVPAGSVLARFYHNPQVANAAVGLALGNFIAGISVIHIALLKRAMCFGKTSTIEFVGRVTYTIVPILMALRGWGYKALVAGIVAQQVSFAVGAWCVCRWVPSLPRRTGKTAAVVRFAAKVYGQFSVRYSTQNTDNLLVGWKFNAAALGFYKRAYDLFALSASQVTAPLHNVALAALSRLKHDRVRFRRNLLSSLGILAFVGMAMGADLTLVRKELVRLVLGPQWGEASRIFGFFGPGIGIMLVYSTNGWIHLSVGRPDRWLRWSVFEFIVTTLLFIVGLHWGPAGVAAAWSVAFWTLLVPAFWYAGKPIDLPVTALIEVIWKYALASLVAGVATDRIVRLFGLAATGPSVGFALEGIIGTSTVFLTLYLAVVILLHRGLVPLHQLAGLLGELCPASWKTKWSVASIGRSK